MLRLGPMVTASDPLDEAGNAGVSPSSLVRTGFWRMRFTAANTSDMPPNLHPRSKASDVMLASPAWLRYGALPAPQAW